MNPVYDLQVIRCTGSPRELGNAQGEAMREVISDFVAQRLEALCAYLAERGSACGIEQFIELGQRCLGLYEAWDPAGFAEHSAIAEAARVSAVELYAVSNMTDLRDVLLLPSSADREGCSACIVPAAATERGKLLAGQTWDLNPTDLDYVRAVHRLPDQGPETWSITCVGSLSLMGMNEHGVAVGTTNIKTHRSRPGVGYLSVLHRAIRATSRKEAELLVEQAPRAAAHTYWLADASGGVELECNSEQCVRRELGAVPLVRTNHCLSTQLRALEGETPTISSHKRLARLTSLLQSAKQDELTVQRAYADRADGVDSICRYAEDGQGTTTNACLICEPETRRIWACRGPADRGKWQELRFERGSYYTGDQLI